MNFKRFILFKIFMIGLKHTWSVFNNVIMEDVSVEKRSLIVYAILGINLRKTTVPNVSFFLCNIQGRIELTCLLGWATDKHPFSCFF